MNPNRILHVVDSLEFGGAEKVVVDLANSMAYQHDIGVCCVRKQGELSKKLKPAVRQYCLDKRDGNEVGLWWRLRKIIRQHNAQIVHLHNWGNFLDVGLACLTLPRVHLIATIHGPYGGYPPGILSTCKKHLRHLFEIVITTRYHQIITVAHSIATEVKQRHLPARKITVIHNGIDAAPSNPTGIKPEGTQPHLGAPLLITVARLAPVKNQQMMLTAFKTIALTLPDARLWFIGDGPSRSDLEELARQLNISDKVWFSGFRDDTTALLAMADLFLLTSHFEGISISLLEAMRAGLPCVAPAVGGIPETIENNQSGYLVEAGNHADLSKKILNLWGSPEKLRATGAAAKARQRQAFSIDSMQAQYLAAYEKAG